MQPQNLRLYPLVSGGADAYAAGRLNQSLGALA